MLLGLRLLWRDWRSGELGVLAAAMVLAVAIVTGISLFAERLQQGITAQSNQFLAAHRVLQSSRPVDESWFNRVAEGLSRAEVLEFKSMVFAGDDMQLASIKAVDDHYPLLGELQVARQPLAAPDTLQHGPNRGEVWVDNRLLPLLSLKVGDSLYVGEAELTVSGVLVSEPDRGGSFFGMGARVMMHLADIAATQIVQPGSTVSYRYLFAGSEQALSRLAAAIKPQLAPHQRWLDLADSQPRVSKALQRAESFMLLAGSLGVGLAGVAIALAARRYSERHFDYVAVMKSLGASAAKVWSVYGVSLLALGGLSALVGCVIGLMLQTAFIAVLSQLMALPALPALPIKPFAMGLVTALVCLLAFALPPLMRLVNISPLRVLRRDLGPASAGNWLANGVGVTGVAALMWWYSGDATLTLAVMAGVVATFAVVGALAFVLLRGSISVGLRAGSAGQLALSSLRRRGLQNALQIVIFSLAIMLLLLQALLRTSLLADWQQQLPPGTPNHFMLNLSADELPVLEQFFADQGLASETAYPLVRGRLMQVNDQPLSHLLQNNEELSGSLDRELGLTWSADKPQHNQLLEGRWWQGQHTADEVSVEYELAQKLGLKLGDTLVFQVADSRFTVTVSSFRLLDWESMQPNFFMMFPPSVLAQYPATYMTSFYLPLERKSLINQLVKLLPTSSVIEMDVVIGQVRAIVSKVSGAVELVLLLIVVSGLLVLVASVQSGIEGRLRDSAVLRTLGASRHLLSGSLLLEFAVLGFLAGLVAAGAAELSVYLLQTVSLDMRYIPHPWVWLVGPLLGAVLVSLVGYLASRRVVDQPPLVTLREVN